MNIMISCVGRQTMLVSAFKSALAMIEKTRSKLITCDKNPYSSGLIVADRGFHSPPFENQSYPNWIIDICRNNSVDLLLTLHVPELFILEKLRVRLEKIGCKLVGIPQMSLKTCFDKVETAQFCAEHGLTHPRIWLSNEVLEESGLPWPLIAKNRFGQGSKGQSILYCKDELENFLLREKSGENYILQEFIQGQEYGIDVVNNFNRKYEGILARRKIAMRNGETDVAVTVDTEPFQDIGRLLGTQLKHQGLLDVDLICKGGDIYILDLNPRFGGGYLFSHLAGANIPAAYIRWATGGRANPDWLKPTTGVVSARGSDVLKFHMQMETAND